MAKLRYNRKQWSYQATVLFIGNVESEIKSADMFLIKANGQEKKRERESE